MIRWMLRWPSASIRRDVRASLKRTEFECISLWHENIRIWIRFELRGYLEVTEFVEEGDLKIVQAAGYKENTWLNISGFPLPYP